MKILLTEKHVFMVENQCVFTVKAGISTERRHFYQLPAIFHVKAKPLHYPTNKYARVKTRKTFKRGKKEAPFLETLFQFSFVDSRVC